MLFQKPSRNSGFVRDLFLVCTPSYAEGIVPKMLR